MRIIKSNMINGSCLKDKLSLLNSHYRNQQTILEYQAKRKYDDQARKQIQNFINGKIVVSHDLANDLQVLQIQHSAFIDTVHLCPHNFGLPFKNKLKNLAMDLLRKPIQWSTHDPAQDAITTLQIVKKHLKQGKGTVQQIKVKIKHPEEYENIWQILKDAQLQKQKIAGLFLRGSRALDLQMNIQGYKSDWDYFCVYDTWAKINGRLIKLNQIDITIYDIDSFNKYLQKQNDIPFLQLFYLPPQHQIINTLKLPQLNIQKIRQSLGFHLSKSKMKIQRFKSDPSKKWKILKTVHMKMRFMDYFLQFFEYGMIQDIKRMNSVWNDIKKDYGEQTLPYQKFLKKYETKANQLMQIVREKYQSKRKIGHLIEPKLKLNHNQKSQFKQQIDDKDQNYHNLSLAMQNTSSFNTLKPNPLHAKLQIVHQVRQYGLGNMDQYRISTKRGLKHQNLIQFKYLQGASFHNPICPQARGIILDEDRNYQIVAYPYQKFFDYNDSKYCQIKDFR